MRKTIPLPGLRAENLLGFLAALGTLKVLHHEIQDIRMFWQQRGSGWEATLDTPSGSEDFSAEGVAERVSKCLDDMPRPHWTLDWDRFLTNSFTDEGDYFRSSALKWLQQETNEVKAAVFSTQIAEILNSSDKKTGEHFDHPFRAARKDYYPGNLKSIIHNTKLSHIIRSLTKPWDYMDAMANQSLRLDHLDDRRHAYQWNAPTEDPSRQKVGCMLGANRLAIEAFSFFPCLPRKDGGVATAFTCSSKTYTWITWPVWSHPCSLDVISSILSLQLLTSDGLVRTNLVPMGIAAIFQSRRVPIEKNKVFLPPINK